MEELTDKDILEAVGRISKIGMQPAEWIVNPEQFAYLKKSPSFLQGNPPKIMGIPLYVNDTVPIGDVYLTTDKPLPIKKPGKTMIWPKWKHKREKEPWE